MLWDMERESFSGMRATKRSFPSVSKLLLEKGITTIVISKYHQNLTTFFYEIVNQRVICMWSEQNARKSSTSPRLI